jgi:hypothetical protein
MRTVTMILLCALALSAAGCKSDKKQDKPGAGAAGAAIKQVAPPKELLVYVGVKNPQQTIDNTLALANQFIPLPLTREGLLDLFSQRARLPRDLIEAIDITRPFWLLGLNDKVIKDKDPAVMIFPIRSRKAFEAALHKKLKKAGAEGKLTRYVPKPGAVGQQSVKLMIEDRFVIAPTSLRALKVTEPFIRGNLLAHAPLKSDVVVHVMVKHVMEDRASEIDKTFDRAMDKVRNNMQRTGPMDQKQVAGATEKTLQRYIDALKSTDEIRMALDVNKEQLTVSLQGDGKPGGRLAALTKRQRPGPPYAYGLLPGSSWLVLSDRGNPAAAKEGDATWRPLLKQLAKGLEPESLRDRVTAALVAASDVLTGDFSLALHKAPTGNGMALSLVTRVTDAGKAKQALQLVAGALGLWVKATLAQAKDETLRGMRVERKGLVQGKAQGELFRLHVQMEAARREQLEKMVGLPLTLGVVFSGNTALVTAGKGAEAQLRAMADAAEQGGKLAGGLAQSPGFNRARTLALNRVGMLYVSAVDLVRWFEGTGHQEMEAIAVAIKGKQVTTAPSLDWGVDAKRKTLDLTARLPAEHFRVFAPIINELRKRGGGGLLGTSHGGWQDL